MWSFRRLWKLAVGVVVMVALTGIAAYVLAARDLDPNHPSLVAGALPPLIPVRDFYANTSSEWAYAPSHDGNMIAWYGVDWTKTVLRVKRTSEAGPFLTLSGAEIPLLPLASLQE